MSVLLVALAALVVMPAALIVAPESARAQEDDAEQQEDAERERIRTVTVRHRDDNLFVAPGQRGWLGVSVEDVDRAAADSLGLDELHGARVLGVGDESPAAEAGLRADDVIVGFDGETVRSVAGLVRLVRETPPGREVELRVVRDGSPRSLDVTIRQREGRGFSFHAMPGMRHMELHDLDDLDDLDDLPEGLSEERMERIRKRMERAHERRGEAMERLHEHMGRLDGLRGSGAFRFHVDHGPRLGVRLESLGDQLAEYFGAGDRGGVLVSSVREDSPAAAAGLRAGDVIVSFGGEAISDVGDLIGAVHAAEAGPTTVTVIRRGEERSMTVEMPEREAREADPGAALRPGDAPGIRMDVPPPPPASPRTARICLLYIFPSLRDLGPARPLGAGRKIKNDTVSFD
jgi:C-terminal processing protease CtpA/Prc